MIIKLLKVEAHYVDGNWKIEELHEYVKVSTLRRKLKGLYKYKGTLVRKFSERNISYQLTEDGIETCCAIPSLEETPSTLRFSRYTLYNTLLMGAKNLTDIPNRNELLFKLNSSI